MEAKQKQILEFLSATNTQFTIPVYQRNYDWDEKQCSILFKDILESANNKDILSHFIGSIVYLHEGVYTIGKKEFSIIDGQQRLTTITLLLCAIYHKAKELNHMETANMIYDRYITDRYIAEEDKFKLVPAGKNLDLLRKIVQGNFDEIDENEINSNIISNYNFFKREIVSLETIEKVMIGIQKLIYVDIALEAGRDDPQKIFESLNSTGLDLSQGDLIRNFILMNLSRVTQNYIYENYWIPIEENTKVAKGNKIKILISEFMRDFITLEVGKIPNQTKVFEEFKNNYKYISIDKLKDELNKIKKLSSIYSKIINPNNEKDLELRNEFRYLKALDQSVVNPFIMGVYNDYMEKIIDKETLINIQESLQNFIWRRYVCGEPTNALNKIFMNLYLKIDKGNYYESVESYLFKQKFPSDKQLKEELKIKNLYKDREKLMYLFERIENYGHNEIVDVYNENITIEHIFPQKPGLPWKSLYSENEYEKMMELRDTISNLTLTGSNSNLGNKTFIEKRNLPIKGYKDSKLYLNQWISRQNEWNLNKMDERFNELFNTIIKIWKSPKEEFEENTDDIIFYCQGPRGYGVGLLKKSKFLIIKGSKASKFQYDSVKVSNTQIIDKLLSKGILIDNEEYYAFNEDYLASSPSTAARLILGRSANGWTEWKTYEGDVLANFKNNNN